MKKANVLVTAGAVLLVIGLAAVWIISRDSDDGPDERTVPVLVARADLSAGEAGEDAVAAGKVSVEQVPESKATSGVLTSTTALSGMIVATDVADGDQVLSTAVRPANLRTGSIKIPEGKQAVAVTFDFTAGGAGYVGAGDHVNVYTTITPDKAEAPVKPLTKLLLTNAEVLDVSTELAPQRATEATTAESATAGRTGSSTITLLLALDADQAEQAVFGTSLNQLYVTVVPKDQKDSTTDGVTYDAGYVEAAGS